SHVDALQGYTTVNGDLLIGRSDSQPISLSGLQKLECLARVVGSLSVRQETGLRTLAGLHNLTQVNGSLIFDTAGLTSLNGLSRLASTGLDLVIRNNPGLTALTGI